MQRKPGRRVALFVWVAVLCCLLAAVVLGVTWQLARRVATDDLQERSRDDLQLYIENLDQALEKYEYLPSLLAENENLQRLLQMPANHASWVRVNRRLALVAEVSGASVVYLLNAAGMTVASSNWRASDTFIGDNYAFRPYFKQAREGRLGRYYALGWTSGKRGYYFSFPVVVDGRTVGVVVVKVALATLERQPDSDDYEFVVTGPEGVIFLSTRPGWRYHTLHPLKPALRRSIRASQRYGDQPLRPLPATSMERVGAHAMRLTLSGNQVYLLQSTEMPEAGWTVHILSATDPVAAYATRSVILAGFGLVVLLLAGVIVIQRRSQAAVLRRAHDQLEQRVVERTADLVESNRQLTHEISEHQRTEAELRSTRNELIQAAKLAAIGELSAGINHELNQPLTAIRSYTENAQTLLERRRADEVQGNLSLIGTLTEHMGQIIRQLQLFSRKSTGVLVPVSLADATDGALALLAPPLRKAGITIDTHIPDTAVVWGDMVRLEQVLVNLVSNAQHALEAVVAPCVIIDAEHTGEQVVLRVSDNGPGIPETRLHAVFDAFVTSKEAGRGLGLGLSICLRIIEEMGGTIHASNMPGGGAVFTVALPACKHGDSRCPK